MEQAEFRIFIEKEYKDILVGTITDYETYYASLLRKKNEIIKLLKIQFGYDNLNIYEKLKICTALYDAIHGDYVESPWEGLEVYDFIEDIL